MAKRSKRYQKAAARIDRARRYPLDEAVRTLVAAEGAAKFDETVELAVKLGVDPRQADQNVRGTVVLPHGTGKSVRLLENAHALLTSLLRAKPASAKGHYMQSVAVSTTMGPGIRIDPATVRAAA